MNEFSRKSILIWTLGIVGIMLLILGGATLATKSTSDKVLGNTASTLAVEVTTDDWAKGPTDAKATVVEYSDFQCPSCKNVEPMVKALISKNPDVRFVYRHFPLPNHLQSTDAAKASEAAGKQGKFWEMHDSLFEHQSDWSDNKDFRGKFNEYAKDLGLNVDQFNKDFESSEISDRVAKSQNGGDQSGVNSTPTFFVNGKAVNNIGSIDEFQNIIDSAKK